MPAPVDTSRAYLDCVRQAHITRTKETRDELQIESCRRRICARRLAEQQPTACSSTAPVEGRRRRCWKDDSGRSLLSPIYCWSSRLKWRRLRAAVPCRVASARSGASRLITAPPTPAVLQRASEHSAPGRSRGHWLAADDTAQRRPRGHATGQHQPAIPPAIDPPQARAKARSARRRRRVSVEDASPAKKLMNEKIVSHADVPSWSCVHRRRTGAENHRQRCR